MEDSVKRGWGCSWVDLAVYVGRLAGMAMGASAVLLARLEKLESVGGRLVSPILRYKSQYWRLHKVKAMMRND